MSELIRIGRPLDAAQVAIVFVHGLGGHPYDTWRRGKSDVNDDPTFWPKWLVEDVPGSIVYTIGYSAAPVGWFGQTMPIEDRAGNLIELLLNEPELAFTPVTFVCHSLGGLLVKRLLLDLKMQEDTRPDAAALLQRIRRVAFLGTPHSGADHALFVERLRWLLWPSSLTSAMASDAPGLRQINKSYRTLALERTGQLEHRVLYETRRTPLGKIVAEGTADPGLNDSEPIATDADHFSIAKPRDRNSLIYRTVRRFAGKGVVPATKAQPRIETLPSFDADRSVDYIGLAMRLAPVVLALGLWAIWPDAPPPAPDPELLDKLLVLAAVQNVDVRLKVAEIVFQRPLRPAEQEVVRRLGESIQSPMQLSPATEERLASLDDRTEIERVISRISGSTCGSSYRFVVDGQWLKCANGNAIAVIKSPNVGGMLVKREALVFHFTGSDSDSGILRVFTDPNYKVSAHLLISRDGAVAQMVPFDRQAWHAGASEWREKGLTGLNAYSIGIEFANRGELRRQPDGQIVDWAGKPVPSNEVTTVKQGDRETFWQTYTREQTATAEGIVRAFRMIQPDIAVLGHSDISNGRKTDPGPAFPLDQLRTLR
jgi:N-acetyl-anhydromuramyl-L-alanine amidase AmpD